jgi:hypothetical protein
LHRDRGALSFAHRIFSSFEPVSAKSAEHPLDRERPMRAQGQERLRILNLSPKPAWTEVWHLWKVIIPRRSISGRLLTGQVWRRYDGRRWIYKKFTEYTD